MGSFVGFPAFSVSMRDIFDLTAIVEMLACVALARRIGPLFNRTRVYILCGGFMLLSTVLLFASCFMPSLALELCFASSVLGGLGLGLIILIFSELYGCLNPIRVTLYYASSLVFGALIVYVYMGFKMPWLFAMTALLPVAALLCARRAFGLLPEGERPQKTWVSVSVPWKIMLPWASSRFRTASSNRVLTVARSGRIHRRERSSWQCSWSSACWCNATNSISTCFAASRCR